MGRDLYLSGFEEMQRSDPTCTVLPNQRGLSMHPESEMDTSLVQCDLLLCVAWVARCDKNAANLNRCGRTMRALWKYDRDVTPPTFFLHRH